MAKKGDNKKSSGSQAAVTPTKASSSSGSSVGAPKSSGSSTKSDRVSTLTQKAKNLIATASGGAIADPAKFKDILGKLKKLDADKRVKNLRQQKQQAVQASRLKPSSDEKDTSSVVNNDTELTKSLYLPGSSVSTGSFSSGYDGGGGGSSGGSYSWDTGYNSDLNKWLSEYQTEQAGRAADYQSMLTDLASQEGQFDPNLFRSLLLELESSKKRQKEWNEQSAKAAYKY
jgi:hypothetical protein